MPLLPVSYYGNDCTGYSFGGIQGPYFFNAKNNCDLLPRALHLFFIIPELTVRSDYSSEICNIPPHKFSFLLGNLASFNLFFIDFLN